MCWGISAALGRAVFTGRLIASAQTLHPIDPLILAQARSTFSLLLFAPVLLLYRGRAALALSPIDFGRCVALGVLGVAASNYLYYLAIQKTNVATAIILQYTAPIWVLLYLVARRMQRATAQRLISVALAVLGSALAIGVIGKADFRVNVLGLGAGLLAAFSFSFYNLAGHSLLERHDRWKILLYVLVGATLCWIVVNPPWKIATAHYSAPELGVLLIFSLTSVLVPFPLYFAGLQHLDATRAVVTSCLEPVFSILITAVALGEWVSPSQVLGIAIVLIATVLVQMPGERRGTARIVEPME